MALNSLFCADVPLSNYSFRFLLLDEQTADIQTDWPKQLKRFAAILAFCFCRNKTVSFLFYL